MGVKLFLHPHVVYHYFTSIFFLIQNYRMEAIYMFNCYEKLLIVGYNYAIRPAYIISQQYRDMYLRLISEYIGIGINV